ncbi:uncharacterized protein LOC135397052 isoform X2 [Ornithodoros turicata]|uniref:uncharacterized protein LOC135397052 isoform X2 n=1 Tax=Ornithodoros turicata TaxID=34597 RepID=UPI00313896E1
MNLAPLVWSVLLTLQWDAALCATIPACPDIPGVGNATYEELERHDATPYMRVRYTCNEGFYLEGSPEIACLDAEQGRQWHPEPPACHGFKNCEDIFYIPNVFVTGDDCCKPGDKLGFECNDDVTHLLVGANELTCLRNGSWDHPAPQCLSRSCSPPGTSPRGEVDYHKDGVFYNDDCCEHGVEARFTCDEEHDLVGQESITCRNREWSAPRPRCKPKAAEVCEDLVVPNSVVRGDKSGGDYFVPYDIVIVDCNHGYRISGTDYLECNTDGTWSDPPSCVEYNCTREDFGPHIIVEEFVNSTVAEFPVDSRIYLKCEEGYMLEGASSLVCAEGGWSRKPKCRRIHCGRPSVPELGWMEMNTSFVGDVASFGCREGYKLKGHKHRFCLANGVWNGSLGRCVAEEGLVAERGCENPGIPDNGVKKSSSYRPGAKVYFSCNRGYRLRGQNRISCDRRGFWSHPLPTCIGTFYYDTPLQAKQKLMKALTITTNTPDAMNASVEDGWPMGLNPNVSSVRRVVYFVIDASNTIGERDFRKSVALARSMVMKINVTEQGHRVGVVIFSNDATSLVRPHVDISMDHVLEKLDAISYTGGRTNLKAALDEVARYLGIYFAIHRIPQSHENLHVSIFLITNGKANLGGSPKQAITELRRPPYRAEVYCIGLRSAFSVLLEDLVSSPIDDHLIILRGYDSFLLPAERLINGFSEYNCTREDFGPHTIVEEFVNSTVMEFPVDSQINLKCEEGYVLEGASSVICAGGGWSRKPECLRIHCGRPSVPEFGWMKINTSFIDDVALFGCRQGYKLIGHENRFCLPNGVWNGSVARCVSEERLAAQRGCESPGIPDNGVKIGNSYGPGAKVNFSCNPGYRLRGNDTILCDHRGFWSHPLPTCIGKFQFQVQYEMPLKEKERLVRPAIKNLSDALNASVKENRGMGLNLDAPGVRHVVYFVIDASSRMGERDFWKGVALARAMIMKINVTERGHRVGVLTFSNRSTRVVSPSRHHSMDVVLERLRGVIYVGGGTALVSALEEVMVEYHTAWARFVGDRKKLKLSIFLITDEKASLGWRPKQIIAMLKKGKFGAEIYGISVSSRPGRDALNDVVSTPIENHLFILRDFDSILWLAAILTNGTINYSVCGRTHRHNIDTGKEDGPQPRIAGGEDVENSWPWMVEVMRSGGLCGGSIISRTWILTAAHCVCKMISNEIVRREEIKIRLGLTDRRNTSFVEDIAIKRIIRHEAYNATTLENDIALLELQSNITYDPYVRPICLPPEELRNNSDFYHAKKPAFVIGWGSNGTWNAMQKLQQVKVTIHDETNCTRAYNKYQLADDMMCASGYGEGDSCGGDGGGPLMQGVAKDEYIWTQVGIVSWGGTARCGKSGKPGVYTNVWKHRRWIDQYVSDAQEAP